MKKRLLLTTLVATMVASTLLVGCSSKEDDKDGNTTTPSSKVEEGEIKDADNSTNVDSSAKEEEDETSYVEKWEDEPDWEAKYESIKKDQIDRKKSEEEAESYAQKKVDNQKFEYNVKKFIFEDMTQNFKHKKEITPINGVYIYEMTDTGSIPSFICDVANIIPEDTETKIYNRECYKEFAGFDATSIKIGKKSEDGSWIYVTIYANTIDLNGRKEAPMSITALLNCNEDGTFSYKSLQVGYDIEPTKPEN